MYAIYNVVCVCGGLKYACLSTPAAVLLPNVTCVTYSSVAYSLHVYLSMCASVCDMCVALCGMCVYGREEGRGGGR